VTQIRHRSVSGTSIGGGVAIETQVNLGDQIRLASSSTVSLEPKIVILEVQKMKESYA
jgi:hypothetical protein